MKYMMLIYGDEKAWTQSQLAYRCVMAKKL